MRRALRSTCLPASSAIGTDSAAVHGRGVHLSPPAILAPEHVGAAGFAVEHSREHEEQVGKGIHISTYVITHRCGCTQMHERALGTPAYRTSHVGKARRANAAGKDELLEGAQRRIEVTDRLLEAVDMRVAYCAVTGNGKFAAEIEQVV